MASVFLRREAGAAFSYRKNVKVGLAWLWEGYFDEFLTGETVALLFSEAVTVKRL